MDEDYLSFGLTGENTKVIENIDYSSLKQIKRIAVPDIPIPAALSMEQEIMPNFNSIFKTLREMSKGN